MKFSNLFPKVAIIVSYSVLFGIATYFGKSTSYVDVLLFVVGLLFGAAILYLDEVFFYDLYADQQQKLLPTEEKQLATRSVLFLLMLFPLGLYMMTSTGSSVGVGLFIGIISGISVEMAQLRNNSELFHKRFLFQLKRKLMIQEEKTLRAVFITAAIFYALIVIFMGR